MHPPKTGSTVVYFFDGTRENTTPAKVITVMPRMRLGLELLVAGKVHTVTADFAPPDKVVDGKRPPNSWDFIY